MYSEPIQSILDQGRGHNTPAWALRADRWLKQLSKQFGAPTHLHIANATDSGPDVLVARMAGPSPKLGQMAFSFGASEPPVPAKNKRTEFFMAGAELTDDWCQYMAHLCLDSRSLPAAEAGRVYLQGNACVPGYAHDRVMTVPPQGLAELFIKPTAMVTSTIHYMQMIPLHESEHILAEKVGYKKFLAIPELDVLDLKRESVALSYAHLLNP